MTTNKALERLEANAQDLLAGYRPSTRWKVDTQYEDVEIEAVDREPEGYSITAVDGWMRFFPASAGVEPKPGQTLREWKVNSTQVRGIAIVTKTGRVHIGFYRTPDQDRVYYEISGLVSDLRQYVSMYPRLDSLRERIQDLPAAFQRRMEHFQEIGGVRFFKNLEYELFVCEQAVLIAEHFAAPADIEAWHKLGWREQQQAGPALAYAEMTGNQYDAAVHLAWAYKSGLEAAIWARDDGALAPVVGSYRDEASQVRGHIRALAKSIESGTPLSTAQIVSMIREAASFGER